LYFDFVSPCAYLSVARAPKVLPQAPELEPILVYHAEFVRGPDPADLADCAEKVGLNGSEFAEAAS
jgi:2-hydroxychromene-2-carboxylate isomerase